MATLPSLIVGGPPTPSFRKFATRFSTIPPHTHTHTQDTYYDFGRQNLMIFPNSSIMPLNFKFYSKRFPTPSNYSRPSIQENVPPFPVITPSPLLMSACIWLATSPYSVYQTMHFLYLWPTRFSFLKYCLYTFRHGTPEPLISTGLKYHQNIRSFPTRPCRWNE